MRGYFGLALANAALGLAVLKATLILEIREVAADCNSVLTAMRMRAGVLLCALGLLGLLALFTHNHLFWVIGLVLAMIDLPDFGTPLRRIAGSVEKIAGGPPDDEEVPGEGAAAAAHGPDTAKADAAKSGVPSHA